MALGFANTQYQRLKPSKVLQSVFNCHIFCGYATKRYWHIAILTSLRLQRAKPTHSIATKKRFVPTTTTTSLMPV
jgi:hypothetical protein